MRYAFADCLLDTERCALTRGGDAVRIRPKVLQVLLYLIENRDRVVSKQELFENLWRGKVVGDATLNSCIKDARRAIGDSGSKQCMLETLHGHGYRFVAALLDDSKEASVEPAGATPPGAEPLEQPSREYKQVSVLACAIINAADLAARLDPEDMDAAMRLFIRDAHAVLARYGGTECERQGDGFTALFGAPLAFEDHARRAAMAAIEITGLCVATADKPLEVGIGLHTGRVVVGELDGSEQLYTAAGETTTVARGIRDAAAAPIVASAELFALIETDFEGSPVDGAGGDATRRFAITGPDAHRGGVPRRAVRKRSRFIGRDEDLTIVDRRITLAAEGNGQVVCVSGEPGIGKSRLVAEACALPAAAQCHRMQANCLAYRQSSPYFPLLQLLRQVCGVSQADDAASLAAALGALANETGIGAGNVAALCAVLDATAAADGAGAPQVPTAQVFAQATRVILQRCESAPLVIVIEDLHWIDTTTEQWLTSFVMRLGGLPAILLLTFRPGYQSAWLAHSFVTQLALPRLSDSDSEALIDPLTAALDDAAELRRQIVINAQGNPFFLEELAFDSAHRAGSGEIAVPTTVQAVLASRIDQLKPGDKQLLQTAAAIGTPVPHYLLAALTERSAAELDAGLRRLEDGEFLFEDPTAESRRYLFRHALTRDVAYQSLLSSGRRTLHRRIATAYEQHFPQIASTQPEIIAHHCTEAGDAATALPHWRRAGVQAAHRSANPEAVTHFEKALEVSESLQPSAALKKEQLEIYLQMGPPLMSSKAFTSPAVEAAYRAARRLCDEVGTKSELLTVLWGLWLHYAHRGRIADARPLARQIVDIAGDVDDDGLKLQAHHAVWTTEIWHGDLETCNEHARLGLALYDRERHASHRFLFGGHDPGVCAYGTAAISEWFLGRPDEAIRLTAGGARLADEIDHPYSRIITLFDYMELESLRGDHEATGRYARQAIDACTDQSVPNYLAVGRIFAGYSAALGGDFDAGLLQMREGLRQYRELGAVRLLAPYLLLLAEVCAAGGLVDDALEAVDDAGELIRQTGEVRWTAETRRVKGEMLLLESADHRTDAAELFGEAVEIAATQRSLSIELRAATSLARLNCDRGDDAEALAVLAPVYDRFVEGFDTRDLRIARELLDTLR